MSGLRIYFNCWNQQSAGQYYRLRVPARALQQRGLAQCFVDDPFQDNNPRAEALWKGGLQVHFLVAGKAIHQQTKMITELTAKTDAFQVMQHPPTVIFDCDDDIEAINPLNPRFCTLGTRDADGRLLDPVSDLGILMQDEGPNAEPVHLWQHEAETPHGRFNAGRNVIQHSMVRKMAATCHAITCTGDVLEGIIKKWNPRTFVYPNSLLMDDFQSFDIRRPKDDVRVMWQGGYSHFPDFYPMRFAFRDAARLMPQIKWVVFGSLFPWTYELINQFRVEFHPWVMFERFHLKLATLCPDINIAPLADTHFNHCKSGIKFYEAAALGVPTLAQRSGPYAREIIDGETGYLFTDPPEFVEKLERLVKDPEFRVAMGQRARDWVGEHRNALKNVDSLFEFYCRLIKDVRGYDVAA